MTEIVTSIRELRSRLATARTNGSSIGFVPTMGYLHAGHARLIESARVETDNVVVSIFVNPLQFAPTEDLSTYPRDIDRDLRVIGDAGGDLVFVPSVEEMYPRPIATTVRVDGVSDGFESVARPTHFAGVATVVTKLFGIVGPCNAYFGEKDYQQLAVVRTLSGDLSLPVTVIGVPTVREADGLAMSSRNVYLTATERQAAPVLYRALCAGRDAIIAGETRTESVEVVITRVLASEPLFTPDYVAAVDATTLQRNDALDGNVRLLIAGRLGKPRLLDNLGVTVGAQSL